MTDEYNNNALGYGSTAEGINTTALGMASHTEGYQTYALATSAHAEGSFSNASGAASHAEGYQTIAGEQSSHAEGNASIATGIGSHAEGFLTTAGGTGAHSEGSRSTAYGGSAHAEGVSSLASGDGSHAEGLGTVASGIYAHAEGSLTTASGLVSHAEGQLSVASGPVSHAEGGNTTASGAFSHSEGFSTTVTNNHPNSHIMGIYGNSLYSSSWHLANGTSATIPGLAAVLEGATGNLYIDGTVMSPAADYAEMFETVDGLPLEPGYFVTSDKQKIRIATDEDNYILGITSGRPSVVGGAYHLNWQGKYAVDEWGRVKYEEVQIPEEKDEQGHTMMEIEPTVIKRAVLNPNFDASRSYTSRIDRPEWVAVGMLGKLLVRDDGTCVENGFCRPNRDGIATASEEGYRVLERMGANQILVVVK
ncbi:hypothetical protein J2Z32_001272 [Paenibacillus turicensis]|uniref:Peptidase G2 IMC autoproteolytic cleavage domain-containing protein n=1 Tax=Paenibacillus turicensis TaxID=160487 RepID=A0ABS4FQI4_9BACL|nr:peptidase G2 autoproteolytic cleavage domain-containing protein [Paenibacillus turicensis]MBP1904649.1 hypothetical protein [Paenibacillus turicensis]